MRKYRPHLIAFLVLSATLICACSMPLRAIGLDDALVIDETPLQPNDDATGADAEQKEPDTTDETEQEEEQEASAPEQTVADEEPQAEQGGEDAREAPASTEGDAAPSPDGDADAAQEQEQQEADADDTAEAQSADEELFAQSTVAEADAYAASHAGDIVDGRYTITSRLDSSYSIDVKGKSTANGATIILYTAKVANNQRWDIAHTSGGYVTIKSVSSGKYLQAGWNGTAHKLVQNARDTKQRGQLWIIARDSDGSYRITSALDLRRAFHVGGAQAKNSANVIAYAKSDDEGNAHRRWNITVTTDLLDAEAKAHKGDLANGTYLLASAYDTSFALAMKKASVANSAEAVLGYKGPTLCQGWIISHTSSGYVTIVNAKSGKALDVKGGKATSGAPIIQWTDKKGSGRNQLWIAAKASDGTITFTSALAGNARYALTVSAVAPKNGTTTVLKAATNQVSQAWVASKAPDQYAYARDVADGTYAIATMLDTTKVLDVSSSSTKNGAGVKLWTSKNSANQFWKLTHDGQGIVHLTNYNSNKELAFVDGLLVQDESSVGWVFEAAGSGQYRVRKAGTNKYLDVKRSNTDNKTNKIVLYGKGTDKNQLWSLKAAQLGINENTAIMGSATLTQAQAVRTINANFSRYGRSLPKKWRDDGVTVSSLVKLFWEEGEAEGVRGDIALAQSLHETGWFQFGGDVKPQQYNFAGIGATGGGKQGAYFDDARQGIRAQIQHLKAYASTKALNNKCVDPRFDLVSRGSAPTLKGLSGEWAYPGYAVRADGSKIYYHEQIISILKEMQAS